MFRGFRDRDLGFRILEFRGYGFKNSVVLSSSCNSSNLLALLV